MSKPTSSRLQDLQDFLDASPSLDRPFQSFSESASHIPAYFSFYDRHVDASLDLQKVHVVPSLNKRLAAIAHSRKGVLEEDDLPPTTYKQAGFPDAQRRRPAKHMIHYDSYLPSRDYPPGTPSFVGAVASTIHFRPYLSEWDDALLWRNVTQSHDFALVDDRPGLILRDFDSSISGQPAFPPELLNSITDAQAHTPAVCVFQFYNDPVAGEQILREMDQFTALNVQSQGLVAGFPSPNPSPYGDTENSKVVTVLISQPSEVDLSPPTTELSSRKRKPEELAHEKNKKPMISGPSTPNWVSVQIAERRTQVPQEDRATTFLIHAWARAVAANSSFIVFNCGSFERIGIRDRENQTLYLTEMIPVHKIQNPGYYAIMTGLYLAMLEDVFSRVPTEKPRRRKGAEKPSLSRSQPRTRSRKTVTPELKSRKIALVSMKYRGLNSSSPSAFIRCGELPPNGKKQQAYAPTEYIHVTITSEIARGYTGTAHTASVKLILQDDSIQTAAIIVKLAMGPDQCRRLRKEMLAYTELSNSMSEGIPQIYGLFEDVEHDVIAMMMECVGESLLTLFPHAYRGSREPVVPSDKRRSYATILKGIHAAGYVHRDIRPENLTMNDKGDVFFIDFDRARRLGHPIPEEKKTEELNLLASVLNGRRSVVLSPASSQRERDRERDRLEYERQIQEKDTRVVGTSQTVNKTARGSRPQENLLDENGRLDTRARCFADGVKTFDIHEMSGNREPRAKKRIIINGVEYVEVDEDEDTDTDADTSTEGSSKAKEGSDTETEGSRTEGRTEGDTDVENGGGEPES